MASSGYQAISSEVNAQSSAYGYGIQTPFNPVTLTTQTLTYESINAAGTGVAPYGYSVMLGAAFSRRPASPRIVDITASPSPVAGSGVIAVVSLQCCHR